MQKGIIIAVYSSLDKEFAIIEYGDGKNIIPLCRKINNFDRLFIGQKIDFIEEVNSCGKIAKPIEKENKKKRYPIQISWQHNEKK